MIFHSNILRDPDPEPPKGGPGDPPKPEPTSKDVVDKSEHVRVSKRLKTVEQDFATYKTKVEGIEKAQTELSKLAEVFKKAPDDKKQNTSFLRGILDEATSILLGG